MKMWLLPKRVFEYLFKNCKIAVVKTLELIEKRKQEEKVLEDVTDIRTLENERETFRRRNQSLITMRADSDISMG